MAVSKFYLERRMPARDFMALDGVSDRQIQYMAAELVEEIRHLDVPSHLHAWAAERNGLKAVRKEISLRGI